MREVTARNVNTALPEAFWHLRISGEQEASRNGPVLVAPTPVCTTYTHPTERVLWDKRRDCNHVFHLMETLWMLAGEDDVGWLLQFNSKFGAYAEPDGTMHGAYGHRWRNHFGMDQLTAIVDKLRRDPITRQAVLQMWSAADDLEGNWKDRPCNTHVYFDLRKNALNMTVCCRSNDMIWGAYGSNVVHFSMLQELLALELGVAVGEYRQFSNNFHVYLDLPIVKSYMENPPHTDDDNYRFGVDTFPMLHAGESMETFLADCKALVNGRTHFYTRFFCEVAYPLACAYLARKEGQDTDRFMRMTAECDWKMAFQQWVALRTK